MRFRDRRGATLIDVIISLAIIAFLFGGIFLVYFSLIDSTVNIDARNSASAAINQEVEVIRNLPYDQVGTLGGVPAGIIPQQQNISVGNFTFSVKTTIRNIDDSFDGVLGGDPNDTAPADYKQVSLEVDCVSCARFSPILFTTVAAPKNLESAGALGSLFINVYDSNGIGVPGATVRVIDASTSPPIDLTDTTNLNGSLQLVGVPPSTASYQISVSKSGYTSDQNYPIGNPSNPNPINPYATVASGTVTSVTFLIDKITELDVYTSDTVCAPFPGQSFSIRIQGRKLIGQNPSVYKFSTTTATNASGTLILYGMEWGDYNVSYLGTYDFAGSNPLSPITIVPNVAQSFRFTLSSPRPDSLLVNVVDVQNGSGINEANVTLSATAFSETGITGHAIFTENDWSGGNYAQKSEGIDAESASETIKLLANASSTYSTSTTEWLISKTIDVGSSTASYYTLSWNPVTQLAETGQDSVKFQLAANNDNSTWNFTGPSGTGSYYTATSVISGLDGNRYIRYKVYLQTENENFTPQISDVSLEFNSICVPQASLFWNGLSAGTYNLLVSAPGYSDATGTVSVGSGWQKTQIQMIRQ